MNHIHLKTVSLKTGAQSLPARGLYRLASLGDSNNVSFSGVPSSKFQVGPAFSGVRVPAKVTH